MDRLETRELSYFVAVARELHFGRAAEQLGIAQPPLSRAIARLERRVGVRLIDRTSRSVALTAAGQAFLDAAQRALTAIDATVQRAREAARPPRLRLATRPGAGAGVLVGLLTAYGEDPVAVPVELVHTHDQTGALVAGLADVALVCSHELPAGEFRTVEVAIERPVALVSVHHPLAGRQATTTAELREDPTYTDVCPAEPLDAIIDRVGLGQLSVVVGEGTRDRLGSAVTAVPVLDLPPTTLVLAWSPGEPNAERDALIHAVATPKRIRGAVASGPFRRASRTAEADRSPAR
ncbi:LysR family transcriptional regulator [Kribbella sp. CA-253562]|uniref:LysR family transcriptional regulator n=1 Tax=Kribbella sp. CA-253562 TaxID=3239942 RepID=UPI003D8E1130